MTAEEIRAEAIERIARARFARGVGTNGRTWDELPDWAEVYLDGAAKDVDALGDLLPVAVEGRYIGRGMLRRTRFVTNWKEPEE